MNILITGAEGFVGPYLINFLLNKNINPSNIYGTYFEAFRDDLKKFEINWFQCDITKKKEVFEKFDKASPSQIYHLAGQSSVGYSFLEPEHTVLNNITGTVNILNWIRKRKNCTVKSLVTSSATIYKDIGKNPRKETTEVDADNFYNLSKMCIDRLLQLYHKNFGLDIVCVRPFNHTGPGQSIRFALPSFAKQISDLEKKSENGKFFTGNLNIWRDFLDVRDVVRAYYLIMNKGKAGDVYNVCSGKMYKLEDLVKILIGYSKVGIETEESKDRLRQKDIKYLVGDYSKLYDLTGWKPGIDIKKTLEGLLNYFRRDNGN